MLAFSLRHGRFGQRKSEKGAVDSELLETENVPGEAHFQSEIQNMKISPSLYAGLVAACQLAQGKEK